jgi:hypothetical protein
MQRVGEKSAFVLLQYPHAQRSRKNMRITKKLNGENYSCDNREYDFVPHGNGVIAYVGKNWWRPPELVRGFDADSALFDSFENAVSTVSTYYDIEYFTDEDEKGRLTGAMTPAEYAKWLTKHFASNKPKRKRRSRND